MHRTILATSVFFLVFQYSGVSALERVGPGWLAEEARVYLAAGTEPPATESGLKQKDSAADNPSKKKWVHEARPQEPAGRKRNPDGSCPVDYTTPFPKPCDP